MWVYASASTVRAFLQGRLDLAPAGAATHLAARARRHQVKGVSPGAFTKRALNVNQFSGGFLFFHMNVSLD
jgi:hypothetical protein